MKVKKFQTNLMRLLFIAMLVLPVSVFAEPEGKECLQYEPVVVSIIGKIEKNWVLRTEKPLCVKGAEGKDRGDDINVTEYNIEEIPLVISASNNKTKEDYRHLFTKKVAVFGTLFHAHTAYHYPYKVLMLVCDIELVNVN